MLSYSEKPLALKTSHSRKPVTTLNQLLLKPVSPTVHYVGFPPCFTDKCITVDGADNGTTCVFPFTFDGVTYEACTMDNDVKPWCSTMVDDKGVHVKGKWGYCDPECPCDGTDCPFKENDEGKGTLKYWGIMHF